MTFIVLVDEKITDSGPLARLMVSAAIRRKKADPEAEVLFGFGELRREGNGVRSIGEVRPLLVIEASDMDWRRKTYAHKRPHHNRQRHAA